MKKRTTNTISAPDPEIFQLMEDYENKCKNAQRKYNPSANVEQKQKELQKAIGDLQQSYRVLHQYAGELFESKSLSLQKEMLKKNKIILDEDSKMKALEEIKHYVEKCLKLLQTGRQSYLNYLSSGGTQVPDVESYRACFNQSQAIKQLQFELDIYNAYLKNYGDAKRTEAKKNEALNIKINKAIANRAQQTQIVSDATHALVDALKTENNNFNRELDQAIKHATMCNRVNKFIEGYTEATNALKLTRSV